MFHVDPYFQASQTRCSDRVDFLVYGECVCGWHCACPEGAQWPACPACGKDVRPRRVYGPTANPCGLGYIAELRLETDAVKRATERGYLPQRTMFARILPPDHPAFDEQPRSLDAA